MCALCYALWTVQTANGKLTSTWTISYDINFYYCLLFFFLFLQRKFILFFHQFVSLFVQHFIENTYFVIVFHFIFLSHFHNQNFFIDFYFSICKPRKLMHRNRLISFEWKISIENPFEKQLANCNALQWFKGYSKYSESAIKNLNLNELIKSK